MKICVVGTGYVGLVTGTCFAEKGHDVRCMDIDAGRVEKLKNGECPIYEPGLGEMLRRNLNCGRLSFTTEMDAALCFIAVGTPPTADGSADLAQVLAAAAAVSQAVISRVLLRRPLASVRPAAAGSRRCGGLYPNTIQAADGNIPSAALARFFRAVWGGAVFCPSGFNSARRRPAASE